VPTIDVVDDSQQCRVMFTLPPESGAEQAWLVGDFNEWSQTDTPLQVGTDGSLSVVVWLAAGHSYRYRYYLGDDRWENDWAADRYVENDFGGADSVIDVPAANGSAAKKSAPKKRAPAKKAPTKAKATKKAQS
jgi:1,4-alpha-glucan branching enzyme